MAETRKATLLELTDFSWSYRVSAARVLRKFKLIQVVISSDKLAEMKRPVTLLELKGKDRTLVIELDKDALREFLRQCKAVER